MAKKKKESLNEKKHALSQKQLIAISIALSLTIAIVFTIFALQSTDIPFSFNAVIIDQLARDAPNPTFVAEATSILQSRNFSVEYYNENLNVAFFKNLTTGNYGIIILRVHSAMREDNSTVDLFTSEEWVSGKYPPELVVPGNYSYDPKKFYCAITYRFIEKLEGYFPKSIIVAMGCWSLKSGLQHSLAEAFIARGAKAYVGWTDMVFPNDTDDDTIKFLEKFLIQNKTLEDATSGLGHAYGPTTTAMQFYPLEARNLTITDLLTSVKSSKSFIALNLSMLPVFTIKIEFLRVKLKFTY